MGDAVIDYFESSLQAVRLRIKRIGRAGPLAPDGAESLFLQTQAFMKELRAELRGLRSARRRYVIARRQEV